MGVGDGWWGRGFLGHGAETHGYGEYENIPISRRCWDWMRTVRKYTDFSTMLGLDEGSLLWAECMMDMVDISRAIAYSGEVSVNYLYITRAQD